MAPTSRARLVVLFGGVSAEQEVSRVSAAHLLRAVDSERYDIVPVAVDPNGLWRINTEIRKLVNSGRAHEIGESLPVTGCPVDPTAIMRGPVEQDTLIQDTTVMPLIHGPLGEDGTIQGLLEVSGVAYTGSGVLGSALCMDKAAAKDMARAHGIPQVAYRAVRDSQLDSSTAANIIADLGETVFVKPANMGSSVGVSKAEGVAELEIAIAEAFRYDEWIVIEEAVVAREIELAVLGNDEIQVSVAGEITPNREFYDFKDKYSDGGARLDVPARLTDSELAEAQELALNSYRALRCAGFARVDLFYEQDGRGFLLNEINTIPGFTPKSMFPMMWAASGLEYPKLIDTLISLAKSRFEHRSHLGRPI